MNKLLYLLIVFPLLGYGQSTKRLTGYVQDAQTGERLIGATLFHPESGKGTTSNAYGFFSLSLPRGKQLVEARFVGYQRTTLELNLQQDTLIVVRLTPGLDLEEVTVKGRHNTSSHPELSNLSFNRINMETIDRIPVILGERDLLKSLQYLPGVKGGRENTTTYNVRGGSDDQNLILLDGVPVYNVSHVFGFFSTFNNDAIKSASFYKGGIPARFGGRLSSVLDISMKEGNMRKASGTFSISPISGRFTYEAPIKRDTASYLISFRRSFIDLPMVLMQKIYDSAQTYGFKFYDFNGKTNWMVNEKNRLYLSIYAGRDKQFHRSEYAGVSTRNHYQWGNLTGVLRWNKLFSPKLFANFSAYFSQYQYEQEAKSNSDETFTEFYTSSKLWDHSAKFDFEYYPATNYTLRFGGKYSHLVFKPNILQVKGNEYNQKFNDQYTNQSDLAELYFENDVQWGDFNINGGGRLSNYFADGEYYLHIQPRLAAGVKLGQGYSLTASYMLMTQHLHLLTNSSLGLPTDLWVASTGKVKPETGYQFALGMEKDFNQTYRAGVEAYYKQMDHVIRFEEGETFVNANENNWEESVLVGQGRAYGSELFVEKRKGRLTGMLSYTLAWSERQFDEVNNRNWFPFKYDRRHDISLMAEYELQTNSSYKKSLSFGFTLQSGNHLSVSDAEMPGIMPPGMQESVWSDLPEWFSTRKTFYEPNNFRMPSFHHLDIGYSSKRKRSNGKIYTWTFSIYNVYNRMNPWYYYKKDNEVRSVSVFPIIPSVSFTYKW
ncbi:TonB-dependent receptor [Sunxiuqinia indica]|uniref:TonB-dependent receptor n=1 Tax=Sunxiuqinia indica TaxID=2692584 RepID=UPI00135C8229|nr:TonB-dependent receptor [Sunxiuqinia indica]